MKTTSRLFLALWGIVVLTTMCQTPTYSNDSHWKEPGSVEGYVVDATTSATISGAHVVAFSCNICTIIAHAVTDEQGYYKISSLPPRELLLGVYAENYVPETQSIQIVSGEIIQFDFALEPVQPPESGSIEGYVTDTETGDPLEEATVVIKDVWALNQTVTDEQGYYAFPKVPVGEHVLVAHKRGYYPSKKVVIVESDTTTEANFELTPRTPPEVGAIAGRVRDAVTSRPIKGAYVYAIQENSITDAAYSCCDGNKLWAVTDEEGNYLIENAPVGNYVVIAEKMRYHPAKKHAEVILNTKTLVNFMLKPVEPPPWGTVKGTVTDADTGQPLENALVFIFVNRVHWLSNIYKICTRTNSEGQYILERVPVDKHIVHAVKRGYKHKKQEITVISQETVVADFALERYELPEVGSVEGYVKDELTSEPIEGALVFVSLMLTPYAECKWAAPHDLTDETGYYRIGKIPVGTRAVVARKKGYFPDAQLVEIKAHETTGLDFALIPRLTSPFNIRVRVIDKLTNNSIEGARIFALADEWILPTSDWNDLAAQSSIDGSAYLVEMYDGAHVLVVTKDGYKPVTLDFNPANFAPSGAATSGLPSAPGEIEIIIPLEEDSETTAVGEWVIY